MPATHHRARSKSACELARISRVADDYIVSISQVTALNTATFKSWLLSESLKTPNILDLSDIGFNYCYLETV